MSREPSRWFATADRSEGDATDVPDLALACEALARGRPVVLPNACPMAYVVVATEPRAINVLKGRTVDQNVGIAQPRGEDWQELEQVIDLPQDRLSLMTALMRQHLVSFLVPLQAAVPLPAWIDPAVRSGQLGMFATWMPLTPVWDQFPRLFGSSANRTGHPPASTAAEARSIFDRDTVVVDGDGLRSPGCTRGSSTILRMSPSGRLSVHRPGAQDAVAGIHGDDFVRMLEESTAA